MASMNQFTTSRKKPEAEMPVFSKSVADQVDSRALQEIIDILKHPWQTSCRSCKGLGFVRNGKNCQACNGEGKVLDNFHRKS